MNNDTSSNRLRLAVHYLKSRFEASIFDIISRSELLSATVRGLHERFTGMTELMGRVNASLKSSVEAFSSTFRESAGKMEDAKKSFLSIEDNFGSAYSISRALREEAKKTDEQIAHGADIAETQNIRALNASIQAARAGAEGKGFAVVAGEVRSLAQRSAQASSEIKALIEETVDRINAGDEVVEKTSSSLEDLMARMEFFFRMMETISASSLEQTSNIGELSRAISQIDGSTQQNASTVEELASTLDNLRTAATVLAEDVQKFKTSDS